MDRIGSLNYLLLVQLAAMVGVLTGHCRIGLHAVRLYILSNEKCQSCMEEGEENSSWHFLLKCPAFVRPSSNLAQLLALILAALINLC